MGRVLPAGKPRECGSGSPEDLGSRERRDAFSQAARLGCVANGDETVLVGGKFIEQRADGSRSAAGEVRRPVEFEQEKIAGHSRQVPAELPHQPSAPHFFLCGDSRDESRMGLFAECVGL